MNSSSADHTWAPLKGPLSTMSFTSRTMMPLGSSTVAAAMWPMITRMLTGDVISVEMMLLSFLCGSQTDSGASARVSFVVHTQVKDECDTRERLKRPLFSFLHISGTSRTTGWAASSSDAGSGPVPAPGHSRLLSTDWCATDTSSQSKSLSSRPALNSSSTVNWLSLPPRDSKRAATCSAAQGWPRSLLCMRPSHSRPRTSFPFVRQPVPLVSNTRKASAGNMRRVASAHLRLRSSSLVGSLLKSSTLVKAFATPRSSQASCARRLHDRMSDHHGSRSPSSVGLRARRTTLI
mmetsp:Transcript_85859/g.243530  ORF Transcript_85859/g.243530 Transcript_85859/m.243530 type:complete len:292 (+) Transcript_85859:1096-1971(+)